MKKLVIALAAISLIAGCSDDDDSTTSSSTAPTTVSGALTTAKSKVQAIVPDTSSVTLMQEPIRMSTGINTYWTDTNYAHGGDFGSSPRGYIQKHGSSTAQSSLMYRLTQALQNLCIFSEALPSTNGLPNATSGSSVTLTSTLKATIVSNCSGVSLSDLPADDTVVGFEVVDVSATSGAQYDYRVGFDMTGGSSYTQYFFFKINSSLNRFSYMEDGTNDSIALFEYVPSTGIARFEFSEDASGSNFKLHYRGILSETTDLARFVAWVKKTDTNDEATAVVSTQENSGDQLHVSFSFVDNDGAFDVTDGQGCITGSTLSVATDDASSCGSITGASASGYTFDAGTNVTTAYITGTGVTTNINFTSLTDILTATAAN